MRIQIQIPAFLATENQTSVMDPWHFVTDPDPGIRTTGLRFRNSNPDFWQDANKNQFFP